MKYFLESHDYQALFFHLHFVCTLQHRAGGVILQIKQIYVSLYVQVIRVVLHYTRNNV